MFRRALYNSPPAAHSKAGHDYVVWNEECEYEHEEDNDGEQNINGLEIGYDVESSDWIGDVDWCCVQWKITYSACDVVCIDSINADNFRVVYVHD